MGTGNAVIEDNMETTLLDDFHMEKPARLALPKYRYYSGQGQVIWQSLWNLWEGR
jgi:hypothetical protein